MKKCSECNCEMVEDCIVRGQHPFEVGIDGRTDISIHMPTGKKITFLGLQLDERNKFKIKARICLKCGKIELYADLKNR